jgi:hypothetical protein
MNSLKVTVRKAEGTPRGDGWYFLVNGEKDGRKLSDVGGEDWFYSERLARQAGNRFAKDCSFDPKYGWIVKDLREN